jgi:hypothetical protein
MQVAMRQVVMRIGRLLAAKDFILKALRKSGKKA